MAGIYASPAGARAVAHTQEIMDFLETSHA